MAEDLTQDVFVRRSTGCTSFAAMRTWGRGCIASRGDSERGGAGDPPRESARRDAPAAN
jgi:hypothetical protein